MFAFTSELAIATFSLPPCHGRHLNSEVPQNCFGLPRRIHKRLRSCWREGHNLDASSSSISMRLHPRVKASPTVLSLHLSTATSCLGVHFSTARCVRKELEGHLGDSADQGALPMMLCPCSAGSSVQALWASGGIQMKDAWFGILVEFLPVAVNAACFKLSGKYFCHHD